MLNDLSRRELALFACCILIAAALTVFGTVYVVNNHLFGESKDPLANAGGLTAVQKTIERKQHTSRDP